MTQWQIGAGVQRVELDADGKAEATFTVTNPGPVDKRVTVEAVGSEQAQASWFSIAEPQRTVPHGGSVTFRVVIRPGEDAPAGTHWLAVRAYSSDAAPEETSVTSDRVSFEVAGPKEIQKPRWWLWAIPAALLVAAVIGVVLFLVLGGGDKVPGVVGKTEQVAVQQIKDAEFVADVQQENSATVASGLVIRQNPAADTEADAGSKVTIVVSSGPRLVAVPKVQNTPAVQAAQAIQKAGLRVVLATSRSNTVPKDVVIRTNPAGDVMVAEGSDVQVLVSSGKSKLTKQDLIICQLNKPACRNIARNP